MSQAWNHVFLNLCHNSLQTKGRLVRMIHQNGSQFECFKKMFKNSILSKSKTFFAEVRWVIYRITWENKFWRYGHLNKNNICYASWQLTPIAMFLVDKHWHHFQSHAPKSLAWLVWWFAKEVMSRFNPLFAVKFPSH